VVERERIITGEAVRPGDVIIGLPSPGLRSNGYSLARQVLLERGGRSLDEPAYPGAPRSLADELLDPSVIYAPSVLTLEREVAVGAVAHITGGGLAGNIARVLPGVTDAVLETRSWEVPPIFGEIQRRGEIADDEMRKVFNLGVGMAIIVHPDDVAPALTALRAHGQRASEIGAVVPGGGLVRFAD
jgi:phosphoribosylformylglycinamidine cyclo-ligase